ncbi:MAG: galactokinase, partial [Gemmatimonadota bacterium]|nr:galactokinase [Gemmatimonadota bacterium]
SQFSFCPVTFEQSATLPTEYCFIVGSSGVLAEKTGTALEKYNRVSRRLAVALDIWRNTSGREAVAMGAAVRTSSAAPQRIRAALSEALDADFPSESLVRRFDQFVLESEELIPSATDALERRDLAAFGEIVARSQAAAELALENQLPQTIQLVASARALGAVAASAFGAGFGGSVWALVRGDESEDFIRRWSAEYAAIFPDDSTRAEFFPTRAGPAAIQL